MKKRDDLPLNYKERLNSRTSFLVSAAVLVVLCLIFNQMDYAMIRQPAAQAKKAAEAQKQKEKENTVSCSGNHHCHSTCSRRQPGSAKPSFLRPVRKRCLEL